MTTVCVSWTSSGTGLTSFVFPISGRIIQVFGNTQATAAAVSFNEMSLAAGVQGSDGGLIGFLQGAGASGIPFFDCDVPIKAGTTLWIDVKTSGSFGFMVSR